MLNQNRFIDTSPKVPNLIPQFFFDILVRMVPGFTLILGVYIIIHRGHIRIDTIALNASGLFIVFFLSYLAGFLLGIFSSHISKFFLDIFSYGICKEWLRINYFGHFIGELKDYPPDVQEKIRAFIQNKYGNKNIEFSHDQYSRIKYMLMDWIRKDYRFEGLRIHRTYAFKHFSNKRYPYIVPKQEKLYF